MTTFSDEIKELNDIYTYMKDEGFTDNQFIETLDDLRKKGTYSKKAVDTFKSIQKLGDKLHVPKIRKQSVMDSIKKTVAKSAKVIKDNIVCDDPCSGPSTGRGNPCI